MLELVITCALILIVLFFVDWYFEYKALFKRAVIDNIHNLKWNKIEHKSIIVYVASGLEKNAIHTIGGNFKSEVTMNFVVKFKLV